MRLIVFFMAGTLFLNEISAAEYPETEWSLASPASMGLDEPSLLRARDYALSGKGSGCVLFRGKQVLSWGDPDTLYDLKSSSKSIGVTLLGVALKDQLVDWDDAAVKHHPEFAVLPESNRETEWIPKITLRMLADQTAGFDKPGGYAPLLFEPGTTWNYSDGGPNWLAECLTLVYRRDLNDVLFERIFKPIGIAPHEIVWRKHAYRPERIGEIRSREFGSGFQANVNAMSRIGYLYLNEGKWKEEVLLPASFVQRARRPAPETAALPTHSPEKGDDFGKASQHYSTLWWNNADGALAEVPRDAFWSWGLYDSLIFVVPSLDLVAVRAGESWARKPGAGHYDVLEPFFVPLVFACPKVDRQEGDFP